MTVGPRGRRVDFGKEGHRRRQFEGKAMMASRRHCKESKKGGGARRVSAARSREVRGWVGGRRLAMTRDRERGGTFLRRMPSSERDPLQLLV